MSKEFDEHLLEASRTGDLAGVDRLLNEGASPETDFDGVNAVHEAIRHGHAEVLRCLLARGADPNRLFPNGESPLFMAAFFEQPACVSVLIAAGANVNPTDCEAPLVFAAETRVPETVRLLLAAGANPNAIRREASGATVLFRAVVREYSEEQHEIVKMLLEHGADPNARMEGGLTPLITAAEFGSHAIVQTLLQAGADPTLGTFKGTVIDFVDIAAANIYGPASLRGQGAEKMIALLRTHGAKRWDELDMEERLACVVPEDREFVLLDWEREHGTRR